MGLALFKDGATAIVFLAFGGLMSAIALLPTYRTRLCHKPRQDWILDLSGLWIQGILVPWLQMTQMYSLYGLLLPAYHGYFHLPTLVCGLISFVVVDYGYYWNHRLLHQPGLWSWHQVHHTLTEMDVLGTSRNTLWTSFLILYVWVHPFFLYLLDQPMGYLIGMGLTAALDLWRHSPFYPQGWLYTVLNPWLILPQDHTQHHSSTELNGNYGANLKCWDQWHGTYRTPTPLASQLGSPTRLGFLQKLLFPLP